MLTIIQSAREWDNGKTGKGSKQKQKEMTMFTGTGSDIIQGTSYKLVTGMVRNCVGNLI